MNCAEFEKGLTDLLAETLPIKERRELADRLRSHAQDCAECGGAADLLEWSSLEPADRFRDDDPGEAYWADFESRLAGRLAQRPARSRAWLAIAAALILAVAGTWVFWPEEPSPVVVETLPAEEFRLPDELEDWLKNENEATWTVAPVPVPATGPVWEVQDLDERERDELLEWLRTQTAGSEGDNA